MDQIVENPKTGRMIKRGGAVYKRLQAEGVKFGRTLYRRPKRQASPRAGVSPRAELSAIRRKAKGKYAGRETLLSGYTSPRRRGARRALARSHPECFLDVEHDPPRFPICNRKGELNCMAVLAAKKRAAEWGYTKIKNTAQKIEDMKCRK